MLDALARLPAGIVVLVAMLLMGLALGGYGVSQAFYGPKARLKRRMLMIVGGAKASRVAHVEGGSFGRRRAIQQRLRQAEDSRARRRGWKLREELSQAGLSIGIPHFLGICAGMAVAAGGLYSLTPLPRFGIVLAVLIFGVGLPKLAVGLMARRRVARFIALFADAIDVVVRGIKSGLPLGECLSIVGREMPEPLGSEFRLVSEGQKLGLSLPETLERAVARTPTPELRFFAIVLSIQQQTGGNLAETLAKLSDVLRARKRMRDKIQAMASEARTSALIIGALPLVVMILLAVVAPGYVGLLFTHPTGHLLLGAGAALMALGGLVMRNMINFDI